LRLLLLLGVLLLGVLPSILLLLLVGSNLLGLLLLLGELSMGHRLLVLLVLQRLRVLFRSVSWRTTTRRCTVILLLLPKQSKIISMRFTIRHLSTVHTRVLRLETITIDPQSTILRALPACSLRVFEKRSG
jgi:hypothetical protein